MSNFQNAGEVAQVSIIERWQWYQAALKDPSKIGSNELPIHPGEYELGYYRARRRKGGPLQPVGIYPDENGTVVAFLGDRPIEDIPQLFEWCCRHPVSYDAYMKALAGEGWADDDPTVAAQIGHNSGDVSEANQLRDQIEAAKQGADAYREIGDDETLAKAQSLRSRLNELAKEADKKREALKRPHLEAGKAVDKEWQPIIKDAKGAADQIRSAMGKYETEKLRKQREAEEARRKAEEEARAAETAGQPAPEPAPVPEPAPAAAPTPIKGSYGKAASVKVRQVVTEVTDWKALSAYMLGHPELDDLLMKLAQSAVDAGRTVPGIKTAEEAKVS